MKLTKWENLFLLLLLMAFIIFCSFIAIKINYKAYEFIVIIAILSITFLYFHFFKSYKRVNESLLRINKSIKAARDGNVSQKIELEDNDIFKGLVENINNMFKAMYNREFQIKSYQEELRSKKENLEAIFNSSTDGIITLSSDLKIIKVNPTITQWAGIPSEMIVGKKFNELVCCNCSIKMSDIDCTDDSVCPIAANWPDEMPREGSITNLNNSKITYVALNCSPIYGQTIVKESFVVIIMDITELKEVEYIKENFVATLTHDLRVPLLAENHALKYLLKGSYGKLTEHQVVAVENMLKSNEDVLKLVNNLLDVYKYESGRTQLYKEMVDIPKLIDECVCELYPIIIKHSQDVDYIFADNIPQVEIDKNEIKRVFLNIINNAINYTPENGQIRISAEFNQSSVTIKIMDNGKGIAENELKNIFERYFSGAKKFRKVGTGLGLYLSKQIISAHGGKIWVESQVGVGSTFYLSLPVKLEDTTK